ncbi:MAG: hypothetical protein LQ338_001099 [Usnochroma carphineum]|nr:MAG: hypothetical protein LQ338_001099 [Usnochroma carphineum]
MPCGSSRFLPRKRYPEHLDGCSAFGVTLTIRLASEQIQVSENSAGRVVSIVRLVILLDLDLKSKDLDYNFAPFGVWTRTEANIAIVCACLPSCRPILSFVLTGSLNPTRQSGHASGKGPALSWPLKQRPSAGASKKGSDTSYVDNDDRHLIARPKKDRGLPWTEAQSSRTIVTGPILERSKPWDSQGNAAPCLSGRWLSDKQTWDEAAFRSGDDVEMQRPNKAASDGINVKNDFTIQWTSSQQ